MGRGRVLLGVAGAMALAVAACSSGDDGEAGSTDAAVTSAAATAAEATTAPSGEAGTTGAPAEPSTTAVATVDVPPCPLDALEGADQPVEVVVWHAQTVEPADALTAVVEEYNASQTRVTVRLESQGAGYRELKRKFQSALPSGDLPALIMFDDTSTQEMADSGVVLPAQSCVQAAGVDLADFLPVVTSYYTIDGVLWPVAANPGGVLLYYNRDHFRAAGLDPDDPPETLAEMRAAAEAIKAAGVAERPVVHELGSWKTEFWLTGAGSPVVDNDNGRGGGETTSAALADNPQALELFTWFDDVQEAELLEAVPSTDGQFDQYFALAGQRSSMLVETSSAATSIEAFLAGQLDPSELGAEEAPKPSGLDIEAAAFPGLVPGHATQMGGAAWYLLNTSPPEVQAAAWDFATFLNSDAAQIRMLTEGSFLPYRLSTREDPAVQEFFSSSLSGRWLGIASEQIDAIDVDFPGPLIGPYDPDFREAIEAAQDALLLGDASPQEALDQAQAEVDDLIELYNESI